MHQRANLPHVLLALVLTSSLLINKSCSCFANKSPSRIIQVCFTPGGQCTQLIEETIANATDTILVQAYFFTSPTIAKALIQAHKKNIIVQIIVDKTQLVIRNSKVAYLMKQGIPIWVDRVPGIAHNKVMIIDDTYVLTGSFNWTDAAQNNNAENLILINDQETNHIYRENWEQRLAHAQSITLEDIKKAEASHKQSHKKEAE